MRTVKRGNKASRAPWRSAAILVSVALLGVAGAGAASAQSSVPGVVHAKARPAGPAADLSNELTAGNGIYMGQAIKVDLGKFGYAEHEYEADGTATAYKSAAALTPDGRWNFEPDTTAPYKSRIVVRAPKDPKKFSGTVVVEWLNVSGGVDADPEWTSTNEEILRAGDAWVGVSAQRIGVEGGPVLVKVTGVAGAEDQGKGLKVIDPARYGQLMHPGDGYSYDIYTQAARALRTGAGLRGTKPKRVIAAGESQSAFALVSYYNGVQPLTSAFDGFLVHSRGASGLPLVTGTTGADIAGAVGRTPTIFRTDQDTPVLDVQTETDVASILNSFAARQPDNKHFRLWEVAGTSHADRHLIGDNADAVDCGLPINNGPMHIIVKAALRALTSWVTMGKEPVKAPRLDVAAGPPAKVQRNADGIAKGGIRTPPVDVPVATLTGESAPGATPICLLSGATKPFTADRLARLYPSRAKYLQQFKADADKTIKAGFALPEDRAALLAFADPSSVKG